MLTKLRKLFILSGLIGIIFVAGYISCRKRIYPFIYIGTVISAIDKLTAPKWLYFKSDDSVQIKTNYSEALDWPILMSSMGENDSLIIKIIENDGKLIHKWNIEWFDIWEDANHLPDKLTPKQRPGTHIHGMHLFEDGSIVFNFEQRGLVKLDKNGHTLWRLPVITHHSINFDGENLWVCGQIYHTKPLNKFPGFKPPFIEPLVLKVSPEGKIIEQTSVFELLYQNNLEGLIYNPSIGNTIAEWTGGVMHLNEVEPFPRELQEGYFQYGDVMLSLRNSNSIVIYNDSTKKVKDFLINTFVRQHDPDFMNGNQISIYDNYNVNSTDPDRQSRILIRSFLNHKTETYYKGNSNTPFFSFVMGKHQWLPNGNLLITESTKGRAFEINQKKEIVWEYINIVDHQTVGVIEEATRIPPEMVRCFIE